jgi:general L-amino acid transport system substrate-binding protein
MIKLSQFRCLITAALGFGALCMMPGTAGAAAASTLDAVRARGHVLCGVSEAQPGFSDVDQAGVRSGLDVEFCTALAAAVFGNKDAVKLWPLSANDGFKALQSGDVDVVARSATWTLSRDTEFGARFTGVLFFDGQGFLTRRGNAVASVLELSGASICALPGVMGEQGIAEFFGAQRMRYQLVTQDNWDDLVKAYVAGSCTVLTGDVSLLAVARAKLADPDNHIILPELITKEPQGPAVRQDDAQWFAVVRWTLMALIEAEELGLSSGNVDAKRTSPLPEVRRFLGLEANLGQALGLPRDWAYQIVKVVGNYGEVFERTVGTGSDLKLVRGLNDLWTRGGLMYSMPFR